MPKFSKIKEELESGNQYYLFKGNTLISKGKTKQEYKEMLAKKINEKPDKYKNTEFILLYFEFREPNNKYTFGNLLVRVRHYKVDSELHFKYDSGSQNKYVWFSKEFLEDEGWKNEYLKNIVKAVLSGKVQWNILGMPDYTSLEGLY